MIHFDSVTIREEGGKNRIKYWFVTPFGRVTVPRLLLQRNYTRPRSKVAVMESSKIEAVRRNYRFLPFSAVVEEVSWRSQR